MRKCIDVVGTMFFKEGKLLIDKPRKRLTYQMVGGRVENNEEIKEAAIRECHEELGSNAVFNESMFEFIMDFKEIATSDPNIDIHMHIFKYNGQLEGTLTQSDEIENFKWFALDDDVSILSNTLRNEIIPYCIKNNLIY